MIMTNEEFAVLVAGLRLDPYSVDSRFLGVVDTNAILSSADSDCRKGAFCRSRLLRMVAGGKAVLYAADHIYAEVYRRLPRMARFSPVPLEVLRARFDSEYLLVLRFVTVDVTQIVDPRCSRSPIPMTYQPPASQVDWVVHRLL